MNYEPTAEILKYPYILKSLKTFKEEFIDSEDNQLSSLAKLANKLYLYWRSVAYTEYLNKSNGKYLESNPSEESELQIPKKRKKSKTIKNTQEKSSSAAESIEDKSLKMESLRENTRTNEVE